MLPLRLDLAIAFDTITIIIQVLNRSDRDVVNPYRAPEVLARACMHTMRETNNTIIRP